MGVGSDIAEEWWGLLQDLHRDYASPTVRTRWCAMWGRTIPDGKVWAVDVADAALVASLGWDIAMYDRDYAAAVDLLRTYFNHPDIDQADIVFRVDLRASLGLSMLCMGDVEQAVMSLEGVLEIEDPRDARHAPLVVRNKIMAFFQIGDSSGAAPEQLLRIVENVVARLRGERLAAEELPILASYHDLRELLESTYPPIHNRLGPHPHPSPSGSGESERTG